MRAHPFALLALPAALAIPSQLKEQLHGKEPEVLKGSRIEPMGDLARPAADWRMSPTHFLGKAAKQECFSISAGATTEWCITNCGLELPNCPETLCSCEDPNAPKKVVKRKLPEGSLIVGYMNYGECDDRVDQAIKDGVNVVIWFSLELENRGEPLITSAVSPVCVQTAVQRLKEAGLNAAHLISVGGWGVPHPDTSFSGAEWYKQFVRWNNAASGPGFENGFDGIDWDLEGADDQSSDINNFTVAKIKLIADFSKLAKKDGFITSIAPPQSYLDVGTPDFSLKLTHKATHWHDEFEYAGRNAYAPWLVMHQWDIVNLQLYESWSPADHFMGGRSIDPAVYLPDLVAAMAKGWLVKFSQVPELGMKDQVVKVSPEQLVIGLANSWSNPLPVGRKLEKWSDSEQKLPAAGRLGEQKQDAHASKLSARNVAQKPLRQTVSDCANGNCPPSGLRRFGARGELIPGNGMNYRRLAGVVNEKALALWPEEAEKAYAAMPAGAKCRGFMFWSISFEGNAVYDGTGFTEMWLARGLNKFLKTAGMKTAKNATKTEQSGGL
jgi:hypothetical protein